MNKIVVGLSRDRLTELTAAEKQLLDDVTWRLVTVADVSEFRFCA